MIDVGELYAQLKSGDRSALSRAITLVESRLPQHRQSANELLDLCLSSGTKSFRFAVSGSPGVGKSTFIESLGSQIIANGQSIAVLAIDPTSRVSGGAILGDKTRMNKLAQEPRAFIRPSAAGDALGGVADATREAIALCEAAGYDNICIETVGVGQSEVTVRDMCDFMLLLVLPGGGDALQGIKRGIVELADMIAINKADGDQEMLAQQTRQSYMQAAHLFPAREHGQQVKVVTCSAINNIGIESIIQNMRSFHKKTIETGFLDANRSYQDVHWLVGKVERTTAEIILSMPDLRSRYEEAKQDVQNKSRSVSSAYQEIRELIEAKLGKQ